MSRYIDADALKGQINTTFWAEIGKIIDNAPSIDLADYVPKDFHDKTCEEMAKRHQEEIADMVSVVRCKECRWYDDEDYGEPTRYCTWHESVVNPDDYCSYGDRKTEPNVVMPKKCKGCDSASKIIEAYSRGYTDGADAVKKIAEQTILTTDCSWK